MRIILTNKYFKYELFLMTAILSMYKIEPQMQICLQVRELHAVPIILGF